MGSHLFFGLFVVLASVYAGVMPVAVQAATRERVLVPAGDPAAPFLARLEAILDRRLSPDDRHDLARIRGQSMADLRLVQRGFSDEVIKILGQDADTLHRRLPSLRAPFADMDSLRTEIARAGFVMTPERQAALDRAIARRAEQRDLIFATQADMLSRRFGGSYPALLDSVRRVGE